MKGLGRSGNETMAWQCSWYICLLRVSLFASSLQKKSQTMPVLSTVEAQLSLHKRNATKKPQKHENGKETGG